MRAFLFTIFLGVGAIIATGVWVTHEFERDAHLKADIVRLEELKSQRIRLQLENERLKRAVAEAGDLDALRKRQVQTAAVRRTLNVLELQARSLKRLLGLPSDPVWPEGATVIAARDWKFVGQSTPGEALQSVLWSARAGDVDRLAGLVHLDPSAKTKADKMFAGLTDAARNQYGSPEKVVATFFAAQMPQDYAAVATVEESEPNADSALLRIRLQDETGDQRDLSFKLEREQDNWRLDVPAVVVDKYALQLSAALPAPHASIETRTSAK